MQLIFVIILIVLIFGILSLGKQNLVQIGKAGEKKSARALTWLDKNAIVLQNVYVPKADGGTSEIDVLYITSKGLFVIESKNYAGYIFGNDKSQNWTVTLYAGEGFWGNSIVEKHHFYNPVWQNNTHIRNLIKLLQMDIPMFSIIVFGDDSDIKAMTLSGDAVVCYRKNLKKTVRQIMDASPDVLLQDQIRQIGERLEPLTCVSEETRSEHVEDIKTKLNDTEHCPRCGGRLVIRTVKNGENSGHQFYGCSNYPKCRYTRNLT